MKKYCIRIKSSIKGCITLVIGEPIIISASLQAVPIVMYLLVIRFLDITEVKNEIC
jgi:hypothetical protein